MLAVLLKIAKSRAVLANGDAKLTHVRVPDDVTLFVFEVFVEQLDVAVGELFTNFR
jgi:hypothetical protein